MVSWEWPELHPAIQQALEWLSEHDALLLFLAILFEEAGIPMPIPADVAMAIAGHRVAQGQMRLHEAFLIGQVATLLGSSVLYWVGRRGGRPLLHRYGRLLRLTPARISRTERLITRLGPLSIIIGRQIPGLRLAAPLASGVFRMPYWQFVPAMVVGSSIYIGLFIALGHFGGDAVVATLRLGAVPLRLLATTALLAGAVFLLVRTSRRAAHTAHAAHAAAPTHHSTAVSHPLRAWRRLDAALVAGLGANALTALALTWLLSLMALLGDVTPERAIARFLTTGQITLPAGVPGFLQTQRLVFAGLILTVPLLVLTQLVWAAVYALVFAHRLPGPPALRGLLFAALPALTSGIVILPLLGAGLFASQSGAAPLLMGGELVRQVVFGAALGSLYRIVSAALVSRRAGRARRATAVSAARTSSPTDTSGSEPPGSRSVTRDPNLIIPKR